MKIRYKQKYQQKNNFDDRRWDHDEYDNYYKKDQKSSQNPPNQQPSNQNQNQNYSYNKQQRFELNRRSNRQRYYQNNENKYVPQYQNRHYNNKSDDSNGSGFSNNKDLSRLEDDTNITDNDFNRLNPNKSQNTSYDEQNYLIDAILHFQECSERIQINQYEQLDSVISSISQKHQLDELTILSIKIMILKKQPHLDQQSLKMIQKGYLDQFIQLINSKS